MKSHQLNTQQTIMMTVRKTLKKTTIQFTSNPLMIISCLILTGCTNLQLSTPAQTRFQQKTWAIRSHHLKQLQSWNIRGAFSIHNILTQKNAIAAFNWKQSGNLYGIRITAALNLYSLSIKGGPGYVILKEGSGETKTAKTPEALMQEKLHWSLPISYLFYWIRGLPAPWGKTQYQIDAFGHLKTLKQAGWSLTFSRYLSVNQWDLPQIIVLKSNKLNIKLVIKNWQTGK